MVNQYNEHSSKYGIWYFKEVKNRNAMVKLMPCKVQASELQYYLSSVSNQLYKGGYHIGKENEKIFSCVFGMCHCAGCFQRMRRRQCESVRFRRESNGTG